MSSREANRLTVDNVPRGQSVRHKVPIEFTTTGIF